MTEATASSDAESANGEDLTPPMTEAEISEVFVAFRRAFRDRDTVGLVATWTPDVRVWHSADPREKDRDEYLAFIAELPRRNVEFVDVRREYFRNGFVQQQIVEFDLPDGGQYRSQLCLVVKMQNGRISRIDEYSA